MESGFRLGTRVSVGPKGATLEGMSPDGEVVKLGFVAAGQYTGGDILRMGQGYALALKGDFVAEDPVPRIGVIAGPGHFDSAANPDFQVTDATRRAAALERRLAHLEGLARAAAKRERIEKRVAAANEAAGKRHADAIAEEASEEAAAPEAPEAGADAGQS